MTQSPDWKTPPNKIAFSCRAERASERAASPPTLKRLLNKPGGTLLDALWIFQSIPVSGATRDEAFLIT